MTASAPSHPRPPLDSHGPETPAVSASRTATTPDPAPVEGPSVWHGAALAGSPRWQFHLTPEQASELKSTAAAALEAGLTPSSLTAEAFPLPLAAGLLTRVARELEHGCGLARIRGFDPAGLPPELIELLWMGLCLQLGKPVYQDCHGQVIRRIEDEGARAASRYGQIDDDGTGKAFHSSRARTASTGPLRFHTDRTDIVGLFCTGVSREGGASQIASSTAVHNAILERRPDHARILYEPIWRSRLGEEAGGDRKAYPLPVFGIRDGKFTSHYSRTYVEAAQLNPDVPKMTGAQWEALDMLAEVAEELALHTQFKVGDMQFINSHVTYHARASFRDDPAGGMTRCLYRVWLCDTEHHRALPEDQRVLWRQVEPGALRGGIALAS